MDEAIQLDGQPSIRLLLRFAGQEAVLQLSCIYGSFRFQTGVEVPAGEVTELACPACGKSVVTDSVCDVCSARQARLRMVVGGDVFFCSRRGCKHHKVDVVDLEKTLVELMRWVEPGARS
jgi:hypothetical protein